MREGWKCPQCGVVLSPDVQQHQCSLSTAPPCYPPLYPNYLPPPPNYRPSYVSPYCDACRNGGFCHCVLGGVPVTCAIGKGLGGVQ